jgi:hypothetical protein
MGIALYNSTSASFIGFGFDYDGTNGLRLRAYRWNSISSFNSDYNAVPVPALGARPCWLQFRDDGTNRNLEYSLNGIDFITQYTIGRTDFITPDRAAWGGLTGGAKEFCRLWSWNITTP